MAGFDPSAILGLLGNTGGAGGGMIGGGVPPWLLDYLKSRGLGPGAMGGGQPNPGVPPAPQAAGGYAGGGGAPGSQGTISPPMPAPPPPQMPPQNPMMRPAMPPPSGAGLPALQGGQNMMNSMAQPPMAQGSLMDMLRNRLGASPQYPGSSNAGGVGGWPF